MGWSRGFPGFGISGRVRNRLLLIVQDGHLDMDVAAHDVAHNRANRRCENAILDFFQSTHRRHHKRRVGRRDLHQGAELQGYVPAFTFHKHGGVGDFFGHIDRLRSECLIDLAGLIDGQVNPPPLIAAPVLPGLHAGIDWCHLVGSPVDKIFPRA
jgi:hypothetical protein